MSASGPKHDRHIALQDLPIELHSEEKIAQIFKPSFQLFLLRYGIISVLTAVCFALFPGLPLTASERIIAAFGLILAWSVAFDDWRDWRFRRGDLWLLTNHRLIFFNPDEDAPVGWLELAKVVSVKRFLWWSVRVRADSGKTTVMRYVGPTKLVQKALRQHISGAQNG